MKLNLSADPYRDSGANRKYTALVDSVITELLTNGLIAEDLTILGKVKHIVIVLSFFVHWWVPLLWQLQV